MAKVTKAKMPVKNDNGAKHTPPVVETDIKRKVGRPKREALTVEQEIIALHNNIGKLILRVNGIEELVLEVKEFQDKVSTVGSKPVTLQNQQLSQIDANITEIKEMLHQLIDSIGEEG